ncbi:MAG: hypothetical protein HXY39_02285 [Chloroflexi bacterium]|nr:hypothetical protein [Chloroflexota bacterium]
MSTQQMRQTTTTRRNITFPMISLSIVALLALAAALALSQTRIAPAQETAVPAPLAQPWSPGGHPTGSVYDGGDYGVRAAESWYSGGHPTGSVYDGGDYSTRAVEPWYPGGHPTGSVYDGE